MAEVLKKQEINLLSHGFLILISKSHLLEMSLASKILQMWKTIIRKSAHLFEK